jgi:hypothetical protein
MQRAKQPRNKVNYTHTHHSSSQTHATPNTHAYTHAQTPNSPYFPSKTRGEQSGALQTPLGLKEVLVIVNVGCNKEITTCIHTETHTNIPNLVLAKSPQNSTSTQDSVEGWCNTGFIFEKANDQYALQQPNN